MNCGRDSSVALGGGFRNQWTLTQPCCASQTRFGTSSTAAIAAASATPRESRSVAPPHGERRDEQHEGDGERVLRLEPDADGDPERGP